MVLYASVSFFDGNIYGFCMYSNIVSRIQISIRISQDYIKNDIKINYVYFFFNWKWYLILKC